MPRKMSGSVISMMEELTVAISMPSVVLDSAIHLYRDPAAGSLQPRQAEADLRPISTGCMKEAPTRCHKSLKSLGPP